MKIKYRHAAQITAILACLVWGGYQITDRALAQSNYTPMVVTETDQELASAYPGVPVKVARSIRSVIATQQITNQATKQGLIASGVIINGQQVLTAGHNVQADDGLACSQTKVIAPGLLSNATASQDAVTHASVRYGKSEDMAVLTVQSSENFSSLPAVTLASRQPETGDTVYFINYQPTADGKIRSPGVQVTSNPATDYSKPAVFSGIVLGSTKNGLAIATGHGQSFGNGAPDTMLRKGASGGAIVNTKGELVGLSVSSESLLANKTSAAIRKEFGIQLSEQRYQIAYMQAVGKLTVDQLRSSMISCGI
jgi:hypothetical protein